jgi:hypothetical protein
VRPNHDRQDSSRPTGTPTVECRGEPHVDHTVDLTGLLRSLAAEPTVGEAMRRLTEYTVEHIPAADAAGLTVPRAPGRSPGQRP